MDMCYNGTLVLPSSYAVMSEDEMTYVEGGVSLNVSWYTATRVGAEVVALQYHQKAGLGIVRTAVEIYAHSVLYYASTSLQAWIISKIGFKNQVNYIKSHSNPIDLGNDDATRVACYYAIWALNPSL